MAAIPHPYYPLDSDLVGYVANTWTVGGVFAVFSTGVVTVMAIARVITKRVNPTLRPRDRWLAAWFMVSGAIHLLVEGYFSLNHRRMASMVDYLGQGWKEYSMSDSRYLTAEPFVVCMESVTAFAWGPLCLVTAWMILKDSPWRHPAQALVSTGQLYGVVLYYATSIMGFYYHGVSYSRPEAYYYWAYFIGMNAPWAIIPVFCIYSSAKMTSKALIRLKELEGLIEAHGGKESLMKSRG